MRHTTTSTHVTVHAWAETDVLTRGEHPGMTGMPRAGDECAFPYCPELLNAGERAVAVIEVGRDQRTQPGHGEAWCGYQHPLHRTWRDGEGDA